MRCHFLFCIKYCTCLHSHAPEGIALVVGRAYPGEQTKDVLRTHVFMQVFFDIRFHNDFTIVLTFHTHSEFYIDCGVLSFKGGT